MWPCRYPRGLADIWGSAAPSDYRSLYCRNRHLDVCPGTEFPWASFGRFLIGGSVAVAFVGTLKLAGEWFPADISPRFQALPCFLGLSVRYSRDSFATLVVAFGWRHTMLASAGVTFAICAGIWLMVRDHPAEKGYAGYTNTASTAGPNHASRLSVASSRFCGIRTPGSCL